MRIVQERPVTRCIHGGQGPKEAQLTGEDPYSLWSQPLSEYSVKET